MEIYAFALNINKYIINKIEDTVGPVETLESLEIPVLYKKIFQMFQFCPWEKQWKFVDKYVQTQRIKVKYYFFQEQKFSKGYYFTNFLWKSYLTDAPVHPIKSFPQGEHFFFQNDLIW